MGKFVALLRGINVGGNNTVKMSDLKACFQAAGFADVRTYINSGNVIFESSGTDTAKLTDKIHKVLAGTFPAKLRAHVCLHVQLKAVVDDAPESFGARPAEYHSDVIFLMPPLTVGEAMQVVQLRLGVDQVWEGKDVLYFARLSARRVQSKLGKIIGTPAYKNMTIRSWNTTTKLLAMLDV